MNLIDVAGLLDSPVPVRVFARALGLEGHLLPAEERDLVLLAFRAAPPDPGTVTVYTVASGATYWQAAPPSVRVVIVPGDQELQLTARFPGDSDGLLAWLIYCRGVPSAEAEALAAKPPTERHSKYQTYIDALRDSQAYELLADNWQVPGADWEYVGEPPKAQDGERYQRTIVTNAAQYLALGKALEDARRTGAVIGLDVESDQEEDYEARLVGVGFAFHAAVRAGGPGGADTGSVGRGPDEPVERRAPVAYYLPLNGPLGEDTALGLLRQHFRDSEPPWFVAHNGKFDMQVLARALQPDNPRVLLRNLGKRLYGDGLIAAYCLARVDYVTGRPLPKGLKDMTERYYSVRTLHFQEMLDLSGASCASEAPLEDIGPYCMADAFWGVRVLEAALSDLDRTPRLRAMYDNLELPTVIVVAEMELLGMPLNTRVLGERRKTFTTRVEVYRRYLEQEAVKAGYQLKVETKMCPLHSRKKVDYAECPACDDRGRVEVVVPYNPNSGSQVEAVIQGTFGLPRFASTDGGAASNDEASLLRLREFSGDEDAKDWITFLLAWRKDNKTRGTYLEGLWERKRRDDWQVEGAWFMHSTFNQAVVESGRFSSKDPNLQNIPLNQRDLFDTGVL